jgi:WD40 repeat protein
MEIIKEDDHIETVNTNINNIPGITSKNPKVKLKHGLKCPNEIITNILRKPECYVVRFEKLDNLIAAGYSTGSVVIYDINKNSYICKSISESPITSLRWKPHSNSIPKNILLIVTVEGNIFYLHTTSGRILHKMNEKNITLLSVDYSRDGSLFAVGSEDKYVRIYDENMKIVCDKVPPGSNYNPGHTSRVNSVCFHKNDSVGNFNNLVASSGWDQRVILYDTRARSICGTVQGPYLCGDAIDLKDYFMLTGSYSSSSKLQLWDIRMYKEIDSLPFENFSELETNIYAAQFSKLPNSNLIAFGSYQRNMMNVYDIDFKNSFNNMDLPPYACTGYLDSPCYTIDFANSSNCIAFSGGDGIIQIVDLG